MLIINRIRIFIVSITLMGVLLSPHLLFGNDFPNGGFETGDFSGWESEYSSSLDYAAKIVSFPGNPVREGNYAARFEIRNGDKNDKDSHRTEIVDRRYNGPFNTNICYRFSVFIPHSWPRINKRCVIAQWHAEPDVGEVWRNPVLAVEFRDDAFLIRKCHSSEKIQTESSDLLNNKTTIYFRGYANYRPEHSVKGKWHDFFIKVKWSHDNGSLKIWIDGDKVYDQNTPIGYNDDLGPFFKMGIYRDDTLDTFSLFHDNYQRGFHLAIPPDIDGDGDVDIIDIMKVAVRWGTYDGDPDYDEACDLDVDGDIDIVDIMKVVAQWGWSA